MEMALPAELANGDYGAGRASVDTTTTEAGPHGTLLTFPTPNTTALQTTTFIGQRSDKRPKGIYLRMKRMIDVVAASVLFIMCLPVILIVAVIVRSTSPGGAFFRQTRVGKDMQPFQCLKFRTMVPDAEMILAQNSELARIHALNWKLDNDPRVTKVGKFLRKTSLDEIPQLVNVINGEMSLIGPRPYLYKELDGEFDPSAEVITKERPGMTGLWQVSGRATLPPVARIQLDMEYARTVSFTLDFKIVVRTIISVLSRHGAH